MRPCGHCGSVERLANGQCRCRTRAYRQRVSGRATDAPLRPETGVVTVSAHQAASFLAWVASSDLASVAVEVRPRAGRCALTVAPAAAWSLWALRYGRG